jgi:hypothetical protein
MFPEWLLPGTHPGIPAKSPAYLYPIVELDASPEYRYGAMGL